MTALIDVLVGIIEAIFTLIVDVAKLFYATWQPPEGYQATFTKPDSILKRKDKGFSVGGAYTLSTRDSFSHLLVAANSGLGKSTAVASNSLFSLCNNGNPVVLDPSKELYNLTSGYYRDNGYEIVVINFSDRTGEESDGWNTFPKDAVDLAKFITTLMILTLGSESRDPYWSLQGGALLIILGKTLYKMEPQYRNMANLLHLVTTFAGQPDLVDKYMSTHADAETWSEYLAFNRNSDNTRASIISTAKAALIVFAEDHIKHITATDTFDFASLRKQRTIVYLQTTASELIHYKLLVSLFFEALIGEILKELPDEGDENIFLMLDEAGIYKINSLPLAVTQARKFRCGIALLVQNELQLYDLYNKEQAATIISNCNSKLYLTNQPLETAQRIEAMAGKREYKDEKEITRIKPLITADELRSMPSDQAILIHGHHRPAIVPLKPYYKHKEYKRYASIPPVPSERKLPIGEVPLLDLKNISATQDTDL